MSQSLDRALTLVGQLAEERKSLDELATSINVHKSTALRLLRTLEAHRFVQRDGPHHYRLGTALFDLAQRSLEDRDVRRCAESALRELNQSTGHTVHLASYEDGEAVYIDKFESRHAVRMYSRIGKRAPLHCTAVGKVLVAALPPQRRRTIAERLQYPNMTENTITSAEQYLAELELVAERGYAVDNAEHEDFIHCIAAPVHGPTGVLAAASLSTPKVIADLDTLMSLLPTLLDATKKASIECGATMPRKES